MWIANRPARLMTALLVCAVSPSAQTGSIVYRVLNATLADGSLAGTVFPVTFSYDASQVSLLGESFVTLNSIDFTLFGVAFNRNDISQGGQVIYRNGAIGNVTASFQGLSMPAHAPVLNITFGFGGDGSIGYIDLAGQFGGGSFTFQAPVRHRKRS